MRIPQLTGKEVVVGAPNMTFEEARVAVLQAASQLQGLLTIYPALEMAAIAEKSIGEFETRKERLQQDLLVCEKEIAANKENATLEQKRAEEGFQSRIGDLKEELDKYLNKIKVAEEKFQQTEQQIQEKLKTSQQEFEEFKQQEVEKKSALEKELTKIQAQLSALQKEKNRLQKKFFE